MGRRRSRISFHRLYSSRYADELPGAAYPAEEGYLARLRPGADSAAPVGVGEYHERLGALRIERDPGERQVAQDVREDLVEVVPVRLDGAVYRGVHFHPGRGDIRARFERPGSGGIRVAAQHLEVFVVRHEPVFDGEIETLREPVRRSAVFGYEGIDRLALEIRPLLHEETQRLAQAP